MCCGLRPVQSRWLCNPNRVVEESCYQSVRVPQQTVARIWIVEATVKQDLAC